MDAEGLNELEPIFQAEVDRRRQFRSEVEALEIPVEALSGDFNAVFYSIQEIWNQIPEDEDARNHYIVLRRDEAQVDEYGGLRPGGEMRATIVPMYYESNYWVETSRRHKAPYKDIKAYLLKYSYVTDDGISVEAEPETTLWEDGDDEKFNFGSRHDRVARVANLPGSDEFSEENAEKLAFYRDVYLPKRQTQIEALRKSVNLLAEALNDPELNPWFAELKAEQERQLAEALEAEAARAQQEAAAEERRRQTAAVAGNQAVGRRFRLRR